MPYLTRSGLPVLTLRSSFLRSSSSGTTCSAPRRINASCSSTDFTADPLHGENPNIECRMSNVECRNPKQNPNPNQGKTRQKPEAPGALFSTFLLRDSDLFRISTFDIRISGMHLEAPDRFKGVGVVFDGGRALAVGP